MIEINSIEEMGKYFVEEDNTYVFSDDVEFKNDLEIESSIKAYNIYAKDINANNIDAYNIKAKDIKANNIDAFGIDAFDINAYNINADYINSHNIKVNV